MNDGAFRDNDALESLLSEARENVLNVDFLISAGVDAESLCEKVGVCAKWGVQDVEFCVEGGETFVVKSVMVVLVV
jgi:hypothetical protein